MGDRFFLSVQCPRCSHIEDDVYYAPTCGITEWNCPKCPECVDLMKLTGISYEDASNLKEIGKIIKDIEQKS